MSDLADHPLRKHIEEITSLSDSDFEYILSHFKYRQLKKHQYVVQADEYVPNDFWVISGCLKQFFIDKNGKEHIIQFATSNWWVTDYDAYYNQTKSTFNIHCMEPCEVLTLSLTNREKLCADMHKVDHFFRRKSNAGYVALQKRILSLLTGTSTERYEKFNKMYPDLINRIPKKYIAAYLGVSRETLSRLYSK
ncbi:MAG: Crp/Fnr family transcriptional regulator [Bacteroidota bacterium]